MHTRRLNPGRMGGVAGVGFLLASCMAVSVLSGAVSSQEREATIPDPGRNAKGQAYDLVTVIPSTRSVMGTEDPIAEKETPTPTSGPWVKRAQFTVTVQSVLPRWGAIVEVVSFQGPLGRAPAGLLSIRTGETGKMFQPSSGPVPIVAGDYKLPVREASVELAFSPTWRDVAGEYRGKLLIRPMILEPGETVLASSRDGGLMGRAEEVDFVFCNEEAIVVQVAANRLDFKVTRGFVDDIVGGEIDFWVWTNAETWRIDCVATALQGERGEIPASRITWERVDGYGQAVESGNVGTQPTILEGHGPVAGLQSRLRLGFRTTMADLAGRYAGRIALEGRAGGANERDTRVVIPTVGE